MTLLFYSAAQIDEDKRMKGGAHYRVTMVVMHLGWVDSDLGSSPGWWAVTVAICCPTGEWNIPNLSQPNPGA